MRTVHLGEFAPAHVERIVKGLDAAGIHRWTKEAGFLSRLWQHGIEVFVDRTRLEEARRIADAVVSLNP